MKIEIVKEGIRMEPRSEKPAEKAPTPSAEPAEEASTPSAEPVESGRGIPAKNGKAALFAAVAAVVGACALFGTLVWRNVAEKRAAEDDLQRRRDRAQLRIGSVRIRPELFGATNWNRSFTGDEGKRWKRIALACEDQRWDEAVPLLLGREPDGAKGGGADATRPFPTAEEIDAAGDALEKELAERERTLSGIRAIVDGYAPSPVVRVSDSASSVVADVSVAGRGIAELQRGYEREDWLGLLNRATGRSDEILPPLEAVREPLRNALASTEAFLVCRGSAADENVCVLYIPPDFGAGPQVEWFREKLPDGDGWMMRWDLRVREAFVLTVPLAEKFVAKYADLRAAEDKRLGDLASRFRLGLISEEEYKREKEGSVSVRDAFLAWARSGDIEADTRKKTVEAARNVFRALETPNRIYANGALAQADPKFVFLGEKGKRWKRALELHRTENWNGLVALFSDEGRGNAANLEDVRRAGRSLSSFRLPVRMDGNADVLGAEDGLWLVELLPDTSRVEKDDGFSGDLPVDIFALPFADRPDRLDRHPDGTGYIIEFPVARCELAVFLGDLDTLIEKTDEMNDQWRTGVRSIRKRLSLTEIDEATATREAVKLANKLKREFVAWLGEN